MNFSIDNINIGSKAASNIDLSIFVKGAKVLIVKKVRSTRDLKLFDKKYVGIISSIKCDSLGYYIIELRLELGREFVYRRFLTSDPNYGTIHLLKSPIKK